MKNRIIALILVVVMSVLALSGCGSYDFTKEDLSSYATWAEGKDLAAFLEALKALEIKDGTFTTDEEIREAILKSSIYDTIVKKIIENTKEADRVTDFAATPFDGGDVLYFVYYATVPGEDGEPVVIYSSDMDVTKVTVANKTFPHFLKNNLRLDDETDRFLVALKEAIAKYVEENGSLQTYLTKNATKLKEEAKEFFESEENKANVEQIKADAKTKFESEDNKANVDKIKADAKEALKKDKPEATEDELNAAAAEAVAKALEEAQNKAVAEALANAQKEAVKVKEGKTYVISYTRTHKVPVLNDDGTPVVDKDGNAEMKTVTETVKFEEITLDSSNPLHAKLLHSDATANVGDDKFNAFISKTEPTEEGKDPVITRKTEFEIVEGETTYTYKDLSVHWLVETPVDSLNPIIIGDYELYAKDDYYDAEGNLKKDDNGKDVTKPSPVTVETLENNGEKIDLVGKKLTIHVYPVYAIDAPSYEEMSDDAFELLYYAFGSGLEDKNFDVLDEAEDYKYSYTEKNEETGEEETKEITVKELLEEIAKVYVTASTVKKEDLQKEDDLNTYYFTKDENGKLVATELWTLLEAYQTEYKKSTSSTATSNALTALNAKRFEIIKPFIEKITAAKKAGDEEAFGKKVLAEHYDAQYYIQEDAYVKDIQKKLNQAVWDVIAEFVKVDEKAIPENLIKEFRDQNYEYHKYEFNVGPTSNSTSARYYDTYKGSFDAYLVAKGELGLKTGFTKEDLEQALKKAAIDDIKPLVLIYFISRELESVATSGNNSLEAWTQSQINGGINRLTPDALKSYKEYYPDNYQDAIAYQEEAIEEHELHITNLSKYFLVNDDYINAYIKEYGNDYYQNNDIDPYGEINFRANKQIGNLFNYLTGIVYEDQSDVTDFEHVKFTYTEDGKYLQFNGVAYTIEVEEQPEGSEDAE